MDNTQLHIIGSKSFFNLLKEIDDKHTISFFDNINKNYLSNSSKEDKTVRIIFPEKLNIFEIKNFINLNLPSIFLLNDKQFFQKNKLKLLDFNVNLSLPIDFLSFVEILRILVIKYKFSQKSKIKIKN